MPRKSPAKAPAAPESRWKSRIVGQGAESPDQLVANPDNWRLHPALQQTAMTEALDQIGWIQQVIVNRTTGHVVDGHLRVELALQNEEPAVPVVYVELSEEEEKLALATLDPLGALADHDRSKLNEIASLLDRENNPTLAEMLDDIIGDLDDGYEPGEGEHPGDQIPAKQPKVKTKTGQRWILGRHRLQCGDCTDPDQVKALVGTAAIDSIVTDPPYGVDYTSKNEMFNKMDKSTRVTKPIAGDGAFKPGEFEEWAAKWLSAARAVTADTNTFYLFISGRNHGPLSSAIEKAGGYKSSEIVWIKNGHVLSRQDYSPKHESILYGWFGRHRFYGNFSHTVIDHDQDIDALDHQPLVEYAKQLKALLKEDIIRHPRPNISDLHPTMKPVELLAKLIRDGSPDEGKILDLFGGSGSTLMAAEAEGRDCFTMEIDPAYCDVIVRRWQDYTGEKAVDATTGKTFGK